MLSKTQTAKNLYEAGDIKAALRIVKDFRIGLGPQERKALSLGYEALVHPAFYIQLKKDPEVLVAEALKVLDSMLKGKA